MAEQKKPQASVWVMDSHSGEITRVNSSRMLAGMMETAAAYEVMKAASDPAPSIGSKRLREKYGITLDGVTCAIRPFDLALYAFALALNTYHSRATCAKAQDIAGGPWKITGGNDSTAQRQQIVDFFEHVFDDRGFSDGMECALIDYEAIGNGYLEVIPDSKGLPAGLAHISAPEMWIRLDGMGFVQLKNGLYAHFRKYGVDPKRYEKELKPSDPLLKDGVTSVRHFTRYLPWSLYYGIPCIMPAWNAMALAVLISEFNLNFFSNNAVPDYAVTLSGEWQDDSENTIRDYFRRHLKGKAHKTLVLRTPDGATIKFDKLTADTKEGSFRLMRQDCRDEVLHAHGVPPSKAGIHETGRLGGKDGEEQNQEYKDSIVTPGRKKVTTFLNGIIRARWADTDCRFEYEPYNTDDRLRDAQIDQIYLEHQVITPGYVAATRYPDIAPLANSDQVLPYKTPSKVSADDLGDLQKQLREMGARA